MTNAKNRYPLWGICFPGCKGICRQAGRDGAVKGWISAGAPFQFVLIFAVNYGRLIIVLYRNVPVGFEVIT